MKKVMLMMAMCLGMFACGNSNAKSNKATGEQTQKDRVEVLYFHGKQRCATCMAIEKNAKEAVEAQFADQLKNGTVVFKSIDISKAENEKIAEKYEVTWSSLFVNGWKDGIENVNNMSEFSFSNARKSPDKLKEGFKYKVDELLKQL